jgi:hypothetical protein
MQAHPDTIVPQAVVEALPFETVEERSFGRAVPRRWGLALAALAILISLVPSTIFAWQARAMPHIGIYHDDAIYLGSAKSMAAGEGYRIASLPEKPDQRKFPPLYPLLLSIAWRIDPNFPNNLPLVMLLSWLMLPASALGTFALLRQAGRSLSECTAFAAWTAMNPIAVMFGLLAMSELMTLAMVVAAMILSERALRPSGAASAALMAGVIAGLAFLTRTAVLPMLVSAPVVFLWARMRMKAALFAAGMLPLVAGWQIWSALHKTPASDLAILYYTDYIGYYLRDVTLESLPTLVWMNLGFVTSGISSLLACDDQISTLTLTIARLTAAATIAGAVKLARKGILRHYAAFGLLFLVQLLLWNYPPNARFLLPLLPLIGLAAWEEARGLITMVTATFRKPKIGERVVAVAAAGVLAAFSLYAVKQAWVSISEMPAFFADRRQTLEKVMPAYRWLEANAAPDSRVLAYADPAVYLYTGLSGISLRVPPHIMVQGKPEREKYFAQLPEVAARHGIDYVLWTPDDYHFDSPEYSLPAWRGAIEDGNWTKPVFRSGEVVLYRVDRSAAPIQ